MTRHEIIGGYGMLTEPATLTIERLLPGPIERVWAWLTESDKRAQWLASGTMEGRVGAPVEFVWRNDELTDPPGNRPDGFGEEHSMKSEITAFDAPHRLAFTWGSTGGVAITLQEKGKDVLLTLVHSRLPDRSTMLNVSSGWHAHLDIMAAKLAGREPAPFWDAWLALKADYDRRLPA